MNNNKFHLICKDGKEVITNLIDRIKTQMNIDDKTTMFDYYVSHEDILNRLSSSLVPTDITDKEVLSFYSYQWSSYENINNHLRNNNGLNRNKNEKTFITVVDDSSFTDYECYVAGVVDGIDNVLSRTSLKNKLVVYRGIGEKGLKSLGIESKEKLLNGSFPIECNINHCYMSSTVNPGGRFFEQRPIILCIKLPEGTQACYLSSDPRLVGEGEFLIERDTQLIINNAEEINDKIYIYCEMKPKEHKYNENRNIVLSDNDDYLLNATRSITNIDSSEMSI